MSDAVAPPERVEVDRADLGVDSGRIGNLPRRDFAVRFAFGAGVSLVAGLVGLGLGQRAGGVLLAFPAVLPAALTLIEKREGTSEAVADVRGAVAGAVGLVGFAVTAVALAGRMPTAPAILVAGAAWGVTAGGLFFGGNLLARALHEQQYLPQVAVVEAEPAVQALRRAGLSVAVAESGSGGALAALLAAAQGGRQVFRGGVVAGSPEARRRLLDLDPAAPQDEALALAMAGAARRRLDADVGLAIAGPLASGPDPGLTWVVAAGPGRTRVARLAGDRSPEHSRGDALRAALRLCREVVDSR